MVPLNDEDNTQSPRIICRRIRTGARLPPAFDTEIPFENKNHRGGLLRPCASSVRSDVNYVAAVYKYEKSNNSKDNMELTYYLLVGKSPMRRLQETLFGLYHIRNQP